MWLSRFFKHIAAIFLNILLYVLNRSYKKQDSVHKQTILASHVSPEPEIGAGENEPDSKLFALIIGINKYSKLKLLKGAVADADAVSEFLATDLKVPSSHIINLRDETASREGILDALRSLKDDPRIHKGDPILIFYAGHGGLKKASDEWKDRHGSDEIQVVFPCDYKAEIPGSKEVVNCIPDRTIAALLNELAAAKGDNITTIFDSCHSASANRDEGETDRTGRLARSADVEIEIPTDIDADIPLPKLNPGNDDSRRPEPLLCTDQSSHIHFAACGSDELAWEEGQRGVFTVALLKTIRASGIDKITYRNLMTSLPMLSKQSPHCYGVHKSRILFNSRVPSRTVTFIPVKLGGEKLFLHAGLSSGVTLGSIWELYDSATEDAPALGCLKAHTPNISYTALVPDGDGETHNRILSAAKTNAESQLYARQVQSGPGNELRVYFSPEAKRFIFPDSEAYTTTTTAAGNTCHEIGYVVHPSRDSADMAVEIYNPHSALESEQPAGDEPSAEPEVVFILCHAQADKYNVSRMSQRKPARLDEVEPVLFAAARWNWHLRRTSDSQKSGSTVSMEMMKLCEVYGDYSAPVQGDLVNLNKTGVVEIVLRDQDRYGLRLSSQAPVPLYVGVFYFDMTDFSISKMSGYTHSNSRPDPEIPVRGQFMVGDKQNGGSPLHFRVRPGLDLEVGFVKLFWSADPLQLDSLKQDSAFEGVAPGESRAFVTDEKEEVKNWGTELMTLVQRV